MGFYKKAAYFCLAAPFLADFAFSVASGSLKNSQISNNIIFCITLFVILSGLALGLLSIIKSEKKKSVILPAAIGVILNLSVVYISFASFRDMRSAIEYFEIQYEKDFGDYIYQESMIGQVPKRNDINSIMNNLSSGVLRGCPSCKITKETIIESLPADYNGIFENKKIKYTYISIAPKDGSGVKVVSLFPEADRQPRCKDLAQIFEAKKQAAQNFADVLCIESIE
jgi:hypothetical protein